MGTATTKKYDAIIIGTGQAGVPLATRLAKAGKKVAIIEKGHFGGTCVNVGCTPTKAYVASARRAWAVRTAEELGVYTGQGVRVDLAKVKARKDKMIKDSRQNVAKALEENDNITVYRGEAQFVNNHTVRVKEQALSAEQIFINVGARPRIPEGFADVDYLTNQSILELTKIPEYLIVVGGSYIGLEFGQMFARFGSRVTIVETNDRLLDKEDPEVSEAIQKILEDEGIDVRLGAECIQAKKKGEKTVVTIDCEEDREVTGTHVLLAVGRIPNNDKLALEHTDIKTDEDGYIQVNDRLETSVPGIWALGDCNGEGAFTHTAYNDYQIVAENLLEEGDRKVSDRIRCYGLFIDPPLGRIGMTERQAKEAGKNVKKVTFDMSKVARAEEKGETKGQMQVIIDGDTDKILGASFLGITGDESIHALLTAMYADAPYTTVRDAVHIHPTVSELIPTLLEDAD